MSDKKVVALPKPKPQPTEGDQDATVLPFEKPRRRCTQDGCDQPHRSNGLCAPHYYAARKAADPLKDTPCAKCGTGRRRPNFSWCQDCSNAQSRAWREQHQDDPQWYALQRLRVIEGNLRLKQRVLAEGYGGRCRCCAEDQISMLQLDHVHGGGNIERTTSVGRLARGVPAGRARGLPGRPAVPVRVLPRQQDRPRAVHPRDRTRPPGRLTQEHDAPPGS